MHVSRSSQTLPLEQVPEERGRDSVLSYHLEPVPAWVPDRALQPSHCAGKGKGQGAGAKHPPNARLGTMPCRACLGPLSAVTASGTMPHLPLVPEPGCRCERLSPPAAPLCGVAPHHMPQAPDRLSTLHSKPIWEQMLPIFFCVHPGWLQLLMPGPKETVHIKPGTQFRAAVLAPPSPGALAPNSWHVGTPAPSPSGQTQLHLSRPHMELPPLKVSGHKSQGMLPAGCCHLSALVQAR